MPHRSRLSILLLDLPPEHHVAGIDFWSAATHHPIEPDTSDDDWNSLGTFGDGFKLEVQLKLINGSRETVLRLDQGLRVRPSTALMGDIKALLGPTSVALL